MRKTMPYTLDNNIVFNEIYINKLPNHIDDRILETFIHEKLHTIQRLHQTKLCRIVPGVLVVKRS